MIKKLSMIALIGLFLYNPAFSASNSSSSSSSSRPSSGGYSKPSSPSPSSGGYTKPSTPSPSTSPSVPATSPSPQSGGYSKPPVNQTAPVATPSNPSIGGIAAGAGAGVAVGAGAAAASPHSEQSGGYTKPSTPSTGPAATTAQPVNRPSQTANDKAIQQSQSNRAFTAYKPPTPPPTVGRAYASTAPAPQVQYSPNYGNWNPPTYVHSVPRYYGSSGIIDGMVWWMMLSSISNASHANAFHNMSNNQEYAAWRREADERAKTDNDLRNQIALLDAKLEAQKGQPIDPNYKLPPEIVVQNESVPEKSSNTWIWALLGTVVLVGGAGFVGFVMLRKWS